jgi:hypothetical protein
VASALKFGGTLRSLTTTGVPFETASFTVRLGVTLGVATNEAIAQELEKNAESIR